MLTSDVFSGVEMVENSGGSRGGGGPGSVTGRKCVDGLGYRGEEGKGEERGKEERTGRGEQEGTQSRQWS